MPIYTTELINLTAEGLVLFITFLVNLTIALVVFFKNPRKRVNVVFGAMMSLTALWNITNFLCNTSVDYNSVFFWTQWTLGAVLFIPAIILYFSYIFFSEKRKLSRKMFFIIFSPGLLMLFFIPTKYNVVDVDATTWGADFTPGPLYIVFIVYFFIFIIWGLVNFILKYRRTNSKIIKKQITYILTGIFLATMAGIVTNAILPLFGIAEYNIYGTPFSVVLGLFVAYAITRYRFMDIKVVLRKSFVYGLGVFVLVGLVVGGGVAIERILEVYLNMSQSVAILLGVAFIVIVFPSLKNYIKEKLDHAFKKDYIDLSKTFEEFETQGMITDIRIENFCQELSVEIKHTLKLSSLYFFVLGVQSQKFERYFPKNKDEVIKKDAQLMNILDKTKGIIIKEELTYFKDGQIEKRNGVSELEEKEVGQLIKLMSKKEIEFIIPLKYGGEMIGFLSGGARDDAESFSSEDIELFEYVQGRTSIVLGQLRQRNNFLR